MSYMFQKDRNDHYSLLIYLFFAFTLTTLIMALMPVSPNRVLAVPIVLAIIFYTYFIDRSTYWEFFLLFYYAFFFAIALIIAKDKLVAFSDSIYLMTALLLLNFLQRNKTISEIFLTIKSRQSIITYIAAVGMIILIIELLIPNCYRSAWGGQKYFIGFTASQHTLASGCCLLLTLIIAGTKGKPFQIGLGPVLALILATIGILESGARTFIVPLLICWCFYLKDHIRSRVVMLIISIIGFILFLYLAFRTNMFKKFQFSLSHSQGDFLSAMSSGRTDFWAIDLRDFCSGNFFQILFGKGFDYIYQLNLKEVGISIGAHNDLINLLLCVGLIGTFIFLYVIIKFIHFSKKLISTAFGRFLFATYILFPMLVNGFYTYPDYLISVVFLLFYAGSFENHQECSNVLYSYGYYKEAIL